MNPYIEGTLEWYAWGIGSDYADIHPYSESPLSGEWVGDALPANAIREVWRGVLGETWDTYADGTDEDRDQDDAILDAWETGAFDTWNNQ